MMVTDDGTDGNLRDHRTRTSPTFATQSRAARTENPFLVSRMDCLLCLRRTLGTTHLPALAATRE